MVFISVNILSILAPGLYLLSDKPSNRCIAWTLETASNGVYSGPIAPKIANMDK